MKAIYFFLLSLLCVLAFNARSSYIQANDIVDDDDDDDEITEVTFHERVKRSPDADAVARRGGGYRGGGGYRSPRVSRSSIPRVKPRVKPSVSKSKKPAVSGNTPNVSGRRRTPNVKINNSGRRRTPSVHVVREVRMNGGNYRYRKTHSRGNKKANQSKTILLVLICGVLTLMHYYI